MGGLGVRERAFEIRSDQLSIVHALGNDEVSDLDRRRSLFSGDIFVYSPRPSTLAFAGASRRIIESALGPDPFWAQQRMPEPEFVKRFDVGARILSKVVLDLASGVVADFGCDPETTFIGAPALAAVTGQGFLAHGLGIPQHPHRDTWYAASPYQLHWFIPLHDLDSSAAFAFHLMYWGLPVRNSSRDFDYEEWHAHNRMGQATGEQMEPLDQPRPLGPIDLSSEVRISCPAGGVILSSVAQLYSAGPNQTLKTHFSVHFQTVSQGDVESGVGAWNLDAEPYGTSLQTFVRCSDMTPIPEELVRNALERRVVTPPDWSGVYG